eukprot:gene11284-15138_t
MLTFNLLGCIYSCIILCIISNINAKSEDESGSTRTFKHPLTDMPSSADDVETASYFPDHPDRKFPIGGNVIALCHLSNDGLGFYNISAIMGSLNSPYDFRHHFQNYSYKPFGVIIKAGEEITLNYALQLHSELEPIEYQLAITVFYESETESYSSTFFNQTVELYFPTSDYDLETVGSVLFSIFATVIVAIVTFYACSPDKKLPMFFTAAILNGGKDISNLSPAKRSRSNRNTTVTEENEGDDWIPVQSKKALRAAKVQCGLRLWVSYPVDLYEARYKMSGAVKENQLFIRNLSFQTTDEDLLHCFESFGPIKHASISKAKDASKGFGFVKFSLGEDAAKALSERQGYELKGRKLQLELAKKTQKTSTKTLDGADKDTNISNNEEKNYTVIKKLEVNKKSDESQKESIIKQQDDDLKSNNTHIRRSRQLLVFGIPIELNKKLFQNALKKLSRKAEVELVKQNHSLSSSLVCCSPEGKVMLVTANSKNESLVLQEKLDKIAMHKLGLIRPVKSTDEPTSEEQMQILNRNFNRTILLVRTVADMTEIELRKRKCRLIIRNLSFQATEQNIIDKMTTFGPVVSVEIPVGISAPREDIQAKDHNRNRKNKSSSSDQPKLKPKGFGFVTFLCEKDAIKAVENSQGLKVCNREVAIDFCMSKESYIKDLPFDIEPKVLKSALYSFGRIVMAIIVKDKVTGISKGSAFVKFADPAFAEACLLATGATINSMGCGTITIQDRPCRINLAVDREEANKLKEDEKNSRDKRNLYLMNEGLVVAEAKPGEKAVVMSELDKEKRQRAQAEKRKKLQNPLFFVSAHRLSIRNLSKSVTDKELRNVCLEATKQGISNQLVSVEDMNLQIKAQGIIVKQPEAITKVNKDCLKSAKIMLDMQRIRAGQPQSRGYGFVEFTHHVHALACLRELNHNAKYSHIATNNIAGESTGYGKAKLIVEFSLENMQKVKILKEREERVKVRQQQSKPNYTNGNNKGNSDDKNNKDNKELMKKESKSNKNIATLSVFNNTASSTTVTTPIIGGNVENSVEKVAVNLKGQAVKKEDAVVGKKRKVESEVEVEQVFSDVSKIKVVKKGSGSKPETKKLNLNHDNSTKKVEAEGGVVRKEKEIKKLKSKKIIEQIEKNDQNNIEILKAKPDASKSIPSNQTEVVQDSKRQKLSEDKKLRKKQQREKLKQKKLAAKVLTEATQDVVKESGNDNVDGGNRNKRKLHNMESVDKKQQTPSSIKKQKNEKTTPRDISGDGNPGKHNESDDVKKDQPETTNVKKPWGGHKRLRAMKKKPTPEK